MVLSFDFFNDSKTQLITNIFIFLISWAFQFVGHKFEEAKPSFLQDLTFLLIGSLWILDKFFSGRLR